MEQQEYSLENYPIFTKEMKRDYKILFPQMLPIHFEFLAASFQEQGFNVEIIKTENKNILQEGLRYVHNDMCYPAVLVIGQLIDALKNGGYDLNKTALIFSQTYGGCRASNYIQLLRKALVKADLGHIPVISLNPSGSDKGSGFSMNLKLMKKFNASSLYGDMLMWLSNHKFAHEKNKGDTQALLDKWMKKILKKLVTQPKISRKEMKEDLYLIAKEFNDIEVTNIPKARIGIVGEIYVKFAPLGNNDLVEFLQKDGNEVVLPGFYEFLMYNTNDALFDDELYGDTNFLKKLVYIYFMKRFRYWHNTMIDILKQFPKLPVFSSYDSLVESVKGYVGVGNKMGEGWLLVAETLELIHLGVPNVICVQPFGCLPNHIIGKGTMKKIKELNPDANLVPIDFDPGISKINQENRIKLMLSTAKKNLKTS
ncbi:MAG: 2-hydroxyglutaryl-CoA dehydratase [Fusobacteriaceae bacterium]